MKHPIKILLIGNCACQLEHFESNYEIINIPVIYSTMNFSLILLRIVKLGTFFSATKLCFSEKFIKYKPLKITNKTLFFLRLFSILICFK